MKTTVLIDDALYKKLVNESLNVFGNAKNISNVLNKILRQRFSPTPETMFGALKVKGAVNLNGLREKNDRV